MEQNAPKEQKWTRVVRMRRKGGIIVQNCDVYIGRNMYQGGWRLKESKFFNPFKIQEYGSRAEVIRQYRAYLIDKIETTPKEWIPEILKLKGKSLGCWCSPDPCHGDVLVEFTTILNQITKMSKDQRQDAIENFLKYQTAKVVKGEGVQDPVKFMFLTPEIENVYINEKICQNIIVWTDRKGETCDRLACYEQFGQYVCKLHSNEKYRYKLPNRENILKYHKVRDPLIKMKRDMNREENLEGDVICTENMQTNIFHFRETYEMVYMDIKDKARTDGIPVPELSAENLGPVHHGMKGIPPATFLCNLWEGSKLYLSEMNDDGTYNDTFLENRIATFTDPGAITRKAVPDKYNGKTNCWQFIVWNLNGKDIYLKPYEAKEIFCTFYDVLAGATSEFKKLLKLKKDGTNLNVNGKYAYDFTKNNPGKTFDEIFDHIYRNTALTMPHEICLAAMLTLDFQDYPWMKNRKLFL
tara:strand:- start:24354 stop:25757 length:1404 start_codon:yes stop_codon:yes gene_type:complete